MNSFVTVVSDRCDESMKSTSHFHFKQFSLKHDSRAMKVGTDAVLVGSWAVVDNAQFILDIGTGSGVIALMMAQRSTDTTKIDAVEIDNAAVTCASENISQSPWPSKVQVYSESIQAFDPGYQYDLIISNPPYFIDSQKPPAETRTNARHTTSLNFVDLSRAVRRLLRTDGKFVIILPTSEASLFSTTARFDGLFCSRKCSFRSRADKPVERIMMEFQLSPTDVIDTALILYSTGSAWSPEYRRLTLDFYLDQPR